MPTAAVVRSDFNLSMLRLVLQTAAAASNMRPFYAVLWLRAWCFVVSCCCLFCILSVSSPLSRCEPSTMKMGGFPFLLFSWACPRFLLISYSNSLSLCYTRYIIRTYFRLFCCGDPFPFFRGNWELGYCCCRERLCDR